MARKDAKVMKEKIRCWIKGCAKPVKRFYQKDYGHEIKFYCEPHGSKAQNRLDWKNYKEDEAYHENEKAEEKRERKAWKKTTIEDIMNDNYNFMYGLSIRNDRLVEKGLKEIM